MRTVHRERVESAPPHAEPPGYDEDFFAWTQHMATLLRAGRFALDAKFFPG
jgi:hypothetical protein